MALGLSPTGVVLRHGVAQLGRVEQGSAVALAQRVGAAVIRAGFGAMVVWSSFIAFRGAWEPGVWMTTGDLTWLPWHAVWGDEMWGGMRATLGLPGLSAL